MNPFLQRTIWTIKNRPAYLKSNAKRKEYYNIMIPLSICYKFYRFEKLAPPEKMTFISEEPTVPTAGPHFNPGLFNRILMRYTKRDEA